MVIRLSLAGTLVLKREVHESKNAGIVEKVFVLQQLYCVQDYRWR